MKFTQVRKIKFLQSIAESGDFVRASIYSGVTKNCVESHFEMDAIFKDQFQEALAYFNETVIEGEMKRRGVEGVKEAVWSNYKGTGNIVGYRRNYSDKMLELVARANIPKFADKAAPTLGLSTTGVLVVNTPSSDASEWASKFGGQRGSSEEEE